MQYLVVMESMDNSDYVIIDASSVEDAITQAIVNYTTCDKMYQKINIYAMTHAASFDANHKTYENNIDPYFKKMFNIT